jgi:DNA-binding transcriptional ArsR family regulator
MLTYSENRIYYTILNSNGKLLISVMHINRNRMSILIRNMNTKEKTTVQKISTLLKEISSPARIKILLAIGREEVCVCHLEATLGMRQAYLSQHLMALRQAGIVITHRDGRFINYRIANPEILDVIQAAADSLKISIDMSGVVSGVEKCPCPKCRCQKE